MCAGDACRTSGKGAHLAPSAHGSTTIIYVEERRAGARLTRIKKRRGGGGDRGGREDHPLQGGIIKPDFFSSLFFPPFFNKGSPCFFTDPVVPAVVVFRKLRVRVEI